MIPLPVGDSSLLGGRRSLPGMRLSLFGAIPLFPGVMFLLRDGGLFFRGAKALFLRVVSSLLDEKTSFTMGIDSLRKNNNEIRSSRT
jgi:hypothetical protein